MAKRKQAADTGSERDTTKKLQQKSRTSKTHNIKEKASAAKTVMKNLKPRVRASRKSDDPSDTKRSKYFKNKEPLGAGPMKAGRPKAGPLKKEPLKAEPYDMSDSSEDVSIISPHITAPPINQIKEEEDQKEVKKEEEDEEEEESDEDEDWEEVEELAGPLGPVDPEQEPAVPSQPVEIEIETAEAMKKRQRKEKRQAEFDAYLRRMMKRFSKELLEETHKVHLLCLLASGLFRNRLLCEADLLAVALSLLPPHFTNVLTERISTGFLEGLLKWFKTTFTLNPELPEEQGVELRELLQRRLGSLSARDHQEMTYLFLLVLRSLRLFCRLVLSLQPVPFKPASKKQEKRQSSNSPPNKSDKKASDSNKISPGSKRLQPAASGGSRRQRGGKRAKKSDGGEEVKEREAMAGGQRPKNSRRRSVASKVSYKEDSSEGEGPSDDEEFQLTSEGESDESGGGAKRCRRNSKTKGKGKGGGRRGSSGSRKNRKKKQEEEEEEFKEDEEEEEEDEEDEDEEEEEEHEGRRRGRTQRGGKGDDEWIEVYLDSVKGWVCVDVNQGVGKPQLCTNQASHPVTYVVGVDGEGYLKDLSTRYDPTWLTSSRRRRIDSEWWEETLGFYVSPETEREKKEDKELQDRLLDKPLPTSISQYKNHPLYVLERHLLKYEALYPRTAAILGYCRGEAVYSRDCVHTLHSRDTWLKQARTVRLGEVPYKMVKGFSNRSRKARMMSERKDEKDLALFGPWQTEEYQPPLAVDGRVPRNEFGNVYMFKPCMLPVGCAHLRLPSLHRVARKLSLDCAAAITGFDYHGGYAHAVTDGYIVCEEHQEILRAAWENEQEILKQKEQEKREKRAVSNWKLLVKGLLIRDRLQRRYGQQGLAKSSALGQEGGAAGLSSGEEEEEEGGANSAAPSLAVSWPQNRQEEQEQEKGGAKRSVSKRERRGQEKHLFPFEKTA
ncbi:DNA repair protein complementing XP-C cells [Astyanax mexicanus]|uniref:DNA repair protein complementing XP-C cells n=1 Tax=Astyanax mexicanus TaxID=7994 RepID=UPI0020CB038C|nr:DNA repair protein complementing XP-C cells [Astyanax mexicanus]